MQIKIKILNQSPFVNMDAFFIKNNVLTIFIEVKNRAGRFSPKKTISVFGQNHMI